MFSDSAQELEKYLSCKKDFKAFRREELPKRLHYSRDERIGEYVLLPEDELSLGLNYDTTLKGIHGYDNNFKSMQVVSRK